MIRTRFSIALLLTAVVAIGCSEDDAPTGVSVEPTFGSEDGPGNAGGSGVIRFSAPIGSLNTWDETSGLIARHYSPDDFCESGETPEWEFHLVTHPRGVKDAVNAHLKAHDIPVYIYLLSEVPPSFQFPPDENLSGRDYQEACDDLQTKWLYKGTHSMKITDNDAFCERQTPNSFGYSANAFVEDRDGNSYRFQLSTRIVVDWDPGCAEGEVKHSNYTVDVHPIGKD